MVGRARVVVFDTQIAKLFDQDENAVGFLKDVIDTILARAEGRAPKGGPQSGRIRQGERALWRMHKSSGVLRRGTYGAGGSAYNDASHALYVHEGTSTPILPHGAYLAIPVAKGTPVARTTASMRNRSVGRASPSGGVILVGSARGQRANPWLANVAREVVNEYRAKAYYRNWARGGTRLTGGMRE
jgi:hypothetical protein